MTTTVNEAKGSVRRERLELGGGADLLAVASLSHTFVTARGAESYEAGAGGLYAAIAELLANRRLSIVHERVFGSMALRRDLLAARSRAFEASGIESDTPVTYLEGIPCWGDGVAGVLVHAVADEVERSVKTLRFGDRACGRAWATPEARYAVVQLWPQGGAVDQSQAEQAKTLLETAEQVLRGQGLAFTDVARTWFYLDEILGGYDAFNAARSEVYRGWELMPEAQRGLILPASTGIGCISVEGRVSLDLIARRPHRDREQTLRQLSNVAQKDAFQYGSAFSRAATITDGSVQLVELSGTAAIDQRGESIHDGDVRAQVEATLDKILALVGPEGAGLHDLASATAFVKRPEDFEAVWSVLAARGLAELPIVVVSADVCRHELLFELDGELLF